MTASYMALLVCHRERPDNNARVSFHEDLPGGTTHVSMLEELKILFSNRQFNVQCFCFSMLAGVSFAVPGFATFALEDLALTDKEVAWVTFSFVFAGVVTGTTLGKLCKSAEQYPMILKGAFAATSLGLVMVLLLIAFQDHLSKGAMLPLLVVAMGITGAASLGFIGIALSAAIETTAPVDAEYSGGSIEWLVQLWGGVFVFSSASMSGAMCFTMVAVPTFITTAMMFTLYHQEFNLTGEAGGEDSPYDHAREDSAI